MPAEPSPTEIAERGYRAWNDDDIEAMVALCHPECEYHSSGVFPGMEPVYHGRAGIRRWWATFHEPWEEIKVIPERIAERGGGVAVLIRFEGLGRQGIEATMHFINTMEFRDDLIYRMGSQPASDEATRELGLD